MILGIDFGSTTTKIVLMDGEKLVEKYRIERTDSLDDVLDKMDLSKVTKIMTVGTGASYIEGDIRGIETICVEEFSAAALGGYFLSGLEECMVVSLGTGTSFVYVNKDKREHVGGSGIGGALLVSMSKHGLKMDNVNDFMDLAMKGDIDRADLLIKDISRTDVDYLMGDVTVANMAKIDENSAPEDYAFGACNLVFQNVGVMAVMADRPYGTGEIVVMGSVGRSAVAKKCFDAVGGLFGYDFIVPEDSVYGVAIGAVLLGNEDFKNRFEIYGQPMDEAEWMFE